MSLKNDDFQINPFIEMKVIFDCEEKSVETFKAEGEENFSQNAKVEEGRRRER